MQDYRFRTVNAEKAKAEALKRIDIREKHRIVADAVREVLKGFEGKDISKRIGTAVEKALPGYTVYYSPGSFSWFELKVWGNGLSYDDKADFLLAYHGSGKAFKMAAFDEHNKRYYEGTDKYKAEMQAAIPEIYHFAAEWTKRRDALLEVENEMGDSLRYILLP